MMNLRKLKMNLHLPTLQASINLVKQTKGINILITLTANLTLEMNSATPPLANIAVLFIICSLIVRMHLSQQKEIKTSTGEDVVTALSTIQEVEEMVAISQEDAENTVISREDVETPTIDLGVVQSQEIKGGCD